MKLAITVLEVDIGVIGCGIAGLTVSYYLLNDRVASSITIFERRTLVPRKHCTGLVSLETLMKLPLASRFVENMYRSMIFLIHGANFGIEIVADRYFACRIDRVRHEIELMRSLNEMGAVINLGCDVTNISSYNNKYFLTFKRGGEGLLSTHFDKIVIAEGYPPKLSRKYGLSAKYDVLRALQEEVSISSALKNDQVETIYVFISPILFGKGFAWLVPIDRYRIIVGYATEYTSSIEMLENVKQVFKNILKLSYRSVEDLYGGDVLQGYPIATYANDILSIGDAVSMVKSISGGGLYAISLASKLYTRIINLGSVEHYRALRKLFKILRMQYIIKNAAWNILRHALSNTNIIGQVNKILSFNLKHLDYDRHDLLIYTFLTNFLGFKLKSIDRI